ncbi:MAG: hypothetical protein JKY90_09935 [Gammaproteobacteria bacterium]|nr:hypothetical protein [Gammaproteobacteria bacterium]
MASSDGTSREPVTTQKWTTIGFTGHRQLDDEKLVRSALADCLDNFIEKYGSIVSYSSVASGADTLFLETAEAQSVPAMIVLPFGQSRFKADFKEEDWLRAEKQIHRAIEFDVVETIASDKEAYLDAGVITVDRCDILLAVWNLEENYGTGGTSDAIKYARSLNKPIIIINAITGKTHIENADQLPAECVKCDTPHSKGELEVIKNNYHYYDTLASKKGPQARSLSIVIILLHLIASGFAITGIIFKDGLNDFNPNILLAIGIVKLLALVLAWTLVFWHHRIQHHWTSTRPKAELYRFFIAIWPLKRRKVNITLANVTEFSDLAKNIMISWEMDRDSELSFSNAKQHYLENRIRDQINYYRSKIKASTFTNYITKKFSNALMVIAIVGALCAVGFKLAHMGDYFADSAILISVFLPLLVAALLAISVAHDTNRRAQRYQNMLMHLETADREVDTSVTWPSLWRAVEKLEYELLNEVEEWHSMTRFSNSH